MKWGRGGEGEEVDFCCCSHSEKACLDAACPAWAVKQLSGTRAQLPFVIAPLSQHRRPLILSNGLQYDYKCKKP